MPALFLCQFFYLKLVFCCSVPAPAGGASPTQSHLHLWGENSRSLTVCRPVFTHVSCAVTDSVVIIRYNNLSFVATRQKHIKTRRLKAWFVKSKLCFYYKMWYSAHSVRVKMWTKMFLPASVSEYYCVSKIFKKAVERFPWNVYEVITGWTSKTDTVLGVDTF